MRVLVGMIVALSLFATSATAGSQDSSSYNASVIRKVFGPYGAQAVRVAYCESRLSIWSRNGQYWGLFQMGSYARSRYGHAWNAWAESRAAYHYFRDSGRTWGPWSCRP